MSDLVQPPIVEVIPKAEILGLYDGSVNNPRHLNIGGTRNSAECGTLKVIVTFYDASNNPLGSAVEPVVTIDPDNSDFWSTTIDAPDDAVSCKIDVYCGADRQQSITVKLAAVGENQVFGASNPRPGDLQMDFDHSQIGTIVEGTYSIRMHLTHNPRDQTSRYKTATITNPTDGPITYGRTSRGWFSFQYVTTDDGSVQKTFSGGLVKIR